MATAKGSLSLLTLGFRRAVSSVWKSLDPTVDTWGNSPVIDLSRSWPRLRLLEVLSRRGLVRCIRTSQTPWGTRCLRVFATFLGPGPSGCLIGFANVEICDVGFETSIPFLLKPPTTPLRSEDPHPCSQAHRPSPSRHKHPARRGARTSGKTKGESPPPPSLRGWHFDQAVSHATVGWVLANAHEPKPGHQPRGYAQHSAWLRGCCLR